jgi:hypothetical protein
MARVATGIPPGADVAGVNSSEPGFCVVMRGLACCSYKSITTPEKKLGSLGISSSLVCAAARPL